MKYKTKFIVINNKEGMPQFNQGQSNSSNSDEEIAKQAQKGSCQEFGLLVERYQDKIIRYGKKFLSGYNDIEDIVQEIFLKAYVNIQSFDASRKFSSWLYRIAHNEFINAIKKQGREPLPFFSPDTFLPQFKTQENIEEKLERKETRQMLNDCLKEINARYREILVLYYFERLSYQEIADVLHIPINTVGTRIKRGKKIMKSLWQKNSNH